MSHPHQPPVPLLVPAPSTPPRQALLTEVQAAEVLGLKNHRTMAAWRLRRCGPPYLRLGRRLVRYALEDLLAWASRREG